MIASSHFPSHSQNWSECERRQITFPYADGEGVPVERRTGPDIDPATHRRAEGYQGVNEGRPLIAPRDVLRRCVRCWRFWIHTLGRRGTGTPDSFAHRQSSIKCQAGCNKRFGMPANSAVLSDQRFSNELLETASTPPENCPAMVLEMRTLEYDTPHSRSALSLRLTPCARHLTPESIKTDSILCIGYNSREPGKTKITL
jgi:hypothetical protein